MFQAEMRTTRSAGAGWRLAASPASVGVARWHALAQLDAWGLPELFDAVGLVVSEPVTNAVKAEGEVVEVRMGLADGAVLIEVHDADPRPPVVSEAGFLDEGGRGLLLVEAYADDWGHHPCEDGGKVVWARVAIPGCEAG